MNFKKCIVASGVAAAVVSIAVPAMAALTVLEHTPEKPPIPPQKVVEEGTRSKLENERLSAEIERLKGELARVQAELASSKSNEQACKDKLANVNKTLDQIERDMEKVGIAILRVNYGVDSSKFEPSQEVGLALVDAGKKARRVNVRGNTDNTGKAEANRALALARALSAKKYMTDRGVARNKVFVFSNGSNKPVGDNATEEGRTQNRRVDIEFQR
jgi:outer membrane protein OmpA-like peptidoglycan-associated protein